MTTKKKRDAYKGTEVSVDKSRDGISKILRTWGATGLQWEDDFTTGNALLRFRWPAAGVSLQARLRLVVTQPKVRDARGTLRTPATLENLREAERRRLHRVAFFWLKAQADAVAAGLFDPATVMLPWLEDGQGRTVGEVIRPMLPQLGRGTLALDEGRSG